MTTRNAFSVDWLAVMLRSDRWTSSSDVTLLLASWYSCWVRVGNRSERGLGGVVGENLGGVVGENSAMLAPRISVRDTGKPHRRCRPAMGDCGNAVVPDRAVVLRQHKLGEADRIVTLLTREHGLVRAVAKGVRRTRSKFGARLEPFAHIDVQLHPGRNLDIVTQVQAIDAFASDIVSDYGRYTCGCAVLETASGWQARSTPRCPICTG